MGKITSYDIDQTPTASDKWIGTDGVTGATRNFNIEGIADSLNVYGLIGVGAPMTLKPDNNDVTPTATAPDFSVSIITT